MSEELPFRFLSWSSPLDSFRTVFDVGANVGNMTSECLQHFPNSKIWAFEPVSATCGQLRKRFSNEPRVAVIQGALGDIESVVPMLIVPGSVGCSIVDKTHPGQTYEQVTVTTGDRFLEQAGIDSLDFLKIDTEGHDLKVLLGFTSALRARAIRFLQVEAGLNCTNHRHVPLQRFLQFLEPLGYHMYRITNQVGEIDGRRILRRADVVFCHA